MDHPVRTMEEVAVTEMELNLIVIAATGLLVGGLFAGLALRKRRRREALARDALARGWELRVIDEPLVSGYRLAGRSGGERWTMEIVSVASPREAGPGSSEVRHRTRWRCEGLPAGGDLVVGPLPPGAGQGEQAGALWDSLGGALGGRALRAMLGEEADWAGGLRPVRLQEPALDGRWLCLASGPEAAHPLLDPAARRALLELPGSSTPLILRRGAALELRIDDRRIETAPALQPLIDLGLALATAFRRGASPDGRRSP